jgi:predicted DNA-binding transcriptional regulator AlpA
MTPHANGEQERLLKTYEVAEWLGVSMQCVLTKWKDFERGDPDGLPGFRLGTGRGVIRFSRPEVEAWLRRGRRLVEDANASSTTTS